MKFNKIIIDADSLIYRCGFAAEGEPTSHACHSLKLQIQAIKERLECEETEIYIGGQGNFRKDLSYSTVYKGTRPAVRPSMYDELREYIINVHHAIVADGMEADDLASIALYKDRDKQSGVVLAAMDKDLWNTPGWHFNYDPRKWKLEYVTQKAADKAFIVQLLEGDKSDNVPGLPHCAQATIEKYHLKSQAKKGCGTKTARDLVKGLDPMPALDRAWEAYYDYGQEQGWDIKTSRDYFLEQGRLLWMTRGLWTDGSPILWEVPMKCAYWSY